MRKTIKLLSGLTLIAAVTVPIAVVSSCGATKSIDAKASKVNPLNESLAKNKAQIKEMNDQKAIISKKADTFKKELLKAIEELKNKKQDPSIKKQVVDFGKRLENLKRENKKIEDKIEALNKNEEAIKKEINALKTTNTNLKTKVSTLETSVGNLKKEADKLNQGSKPAGLKPITYLNNHKLKKTDTLDVKDDVVLLAKSYYSGTIDDIYDGTKDGIGMVNQKTTRFDMFTKDKAQAVMLDNEDSFIYAFDKDNTDGLTVDNFIKTHWFVDSSVNWDPKTKAKNDKLGVFRVGWDTYVPFQGSKEKGHSTIFYGSQNNHTKLTWKDSMLHIKKVHPDYFNVLRMYYRKASKIFVPILTENENWITYEKIATNAIKVTFHDTDDTPITAAYFSTKPDLPNAKYSYVGPLSISPQDHFAYQTKGYTILGDHK